MPARVPTPTKKRIASLAEEGFSQVEIARELSIDRRTVACYVEGVSRPAPRVTPVVATVPQIPAELLDKLRFLAAGVGSAACPTCQTTILYLPTQTQGTCANCKTTWTNAPQGPDNRSARPPVGQTYRASSTGPATGTGRGY